MAIDRSPKTTKRTIKPLWVLGAAATVCVVLAILELTHVTNFMQRSPTPVSSDPTPEQQKQQAEVAAEQKKQSIENPAATTTPDSSTVESAALSLAARKESNGTVTVSTNLGVIPDGTCTLHITNGSQSTSQTATVIYQPQYSVCAGFSVPISSVGTGSWKLTLSVTSRDTTVSKTLTQEVD